MKTCLRLLVLCGVLFISLPQMASADEMLMARINMDFPEAMLKLQGTLKHQGYTISRVQRIDIGLTKSGYKTDKYRVVFYGKPEEVKNISARYPQLIPYLPLKLALFAEANDTLLIAANPLMLAPKADKELKSYLTHWAHDLQKLLTTMRSSSD